MKSRKKERRYGSFSLSRYLLDNYGEDFIRKIFNRLTFVPFRVEQVYCSDSFHYMGYSPLFDAVPDVFEIPFYDIDVKITKRKKILEVQLRQSKICGQLLVEINQPSAPSLS